MVGFPPTRLPGCPGPCDSLGELPSGHRPVAEGDSCGHWGQGWGICTEKGLSGPTITLQRSHFGHKWPVLVPTGNKHVEEVKVLTAGLRAFCVTSGHSPGQGRACLRGLTDPLGLNSSSASLSPQLTECRLRPGTGPVTQMHLILTVTSSRCGAPIISPFGQIRKLRLREMK